MERRRRSSNRRLSPSSVPPLPYLHIHFQTIHVQKYTFKACTFEKTLIYSDQVSQSALLLLQSLPFSFSLSSPRALHGQRFAGQKDMMSGVHKIRRASLLLKLKFSESCQKNVGPTITDNISDIKFFRVSLGSLVLLG